MMNYPYYVPPFIKSPEELEAEQRKMMDEYTKSYGNFMSKQNPNTYTKINDFAIVKQAQPLDNGLPLVFLDETNMYLHSKKIVNGIPCIQSFKLTPCEYRHEERDVSSQRNIEERLTRIEEILNAKPNDNADEQSQAKESTSV